ncbi:MAG: cytochrome-c oxidase, cbb3-type subunit III [Novosphingobium sp.]
MGLSERDPHSGHQTTGHEWNGIKELNTPVPWPVWAFLIATFLFGVVYWVLMPAWPMGRTYTRGLLGVDQRTTVTQQVARADADRAAWTRKIAALDIGQIRADPALMKAVREDGSRLFGDNCAACHGSDARGGKGFPNLIDGDWLWGGTPEQIAQTIAVGVNSPASKATRVSQMLSFGRDGILDNNSVLAVADYVRSLSNPAVARGAGAKSVAAGRVVFAANCVTCHGPDGHGNPALGAPNLADRTWLYGGDAQSVYTSVHEGRRGEMPAWGGRLTAVDRKILLIWLLDKQAQQGGTAR